MVDDAGYINLLKNKCVKFNNYELEELNPYCKKIVKEIDGTLATTKFEFSEDPYRLPNQYNKNTFISKLAHDNKVTFSQDFDVLYYDSECNKLSGVFDFNTCAFDPLVYIVSI